MLRRIISYDEGKKIINETMHELKFCITLDEVDYAKNLACMYKSNLDIMDCMQHRHCHGCFIDRACNDQKRRINNLNRLLSVTY